MGKLTTKKLCSKCKILKNLEQFHERSKKVKGIKTIIGHASYCKLCKREQTRKRHAYFKSQNLLENNNQEVILRTKKCCRCNEEKSFDEFHKNIQRQHGIGTICKPCSTIRQSEYRATSKGRFNEYVQHAKKRKIQFFLSFEAACNLFFKECFYCGGKNPLGIDRKNNDLGYVSENCVSCCSDCNYAKHTKSSTEFVELCMRVIKNMKSKNLFQEILTK